MLAGSKLMSAADIAELTDAYLVLRKAENALQLIRDEQTHSLPDLPVDRARLSGNMGLPDRPAVTPRIGAARDTAARQFDALLSGAPETRQPDEVTDAEWLACDDAKTDAY